MLSRRQLVSQVVGSMTALYLGTRPRRTTGAEPAGVLLNDMQSQLNPTRVKAVARPQTVEELEQFLALAKKEGKAVSVAGGRHSMGGQQFGTDNLHVDTTALSRVLSLDEERGLAKVEAGIQWPE